MITAKFFQIISNHFSESLPPALQTLRGPLKEQLNLALEMAVTKLDLISREEFDIQTLQLAKLEEKIQKLENRISVLESFHKS